MKLTIRTDVPLTKDWQAVLVREEVFRTIRDVVDRFYPGATFTMGLKVGDKPWNQ